VHGLDVILREAWLRGAVLAGVSAGMICWFESSITDSFGRVEAFSDGLGFLAGSACPHYDGEPDRRPTYHAAIADGLLDGHAADDGAALHFAGDRLVEAVASRPAACAYRVRRQDSGVAEEVIPTRFLGA
jgi:peptidase E